MEYWQGFVKYIACNTVMQEGGKYVSGCPCILIKSKPVTYVSLISFYKLSLICMFVVDLIYKFFNLVKAKHNIQISIYCTQFISSIIKIELR